VVESNKSRLLERCVIASYNFFCVLIVILFSIKGKDEDVILFKIGVRVRFLSSYFC